MAIAIALVLVVVGAVLLWAGYHGWRHLVRGVEQLAAPAPPRPERPETPEVRHAVRADALVYLFADHFVRPPKAGRAVNPRFQARAPLTGEELDPRDFAAKLLFVLFMEDAEEGAIEYRLIERVPTLMPPFPHKNWELQVRRSGTPVSSPLGDCLVVAFEMVEKKMHLPEISEDTHARTTLTPGEAPWVPLDLLVEKILEVVRAETTFWQREGVYGDLRNYVEDCLVAEGYLVERGGNTWIEHLRKRRLEPNREAIEPLAPAAEALLQAMRRIRQRYGSAELLGEDERQASYTHVNAPAHLTQVEGDVTDILWADALGLTLYETLVGLRQLEPNAEGGA
jgi:hypothetical protein